MSVEKHGARTLWVQDLVEMVAEDGYLEDLARYAEKLKATAEKEDPRMRNRYLEGVRLITKVIEKHQKTGTAMVPVNVYQRVLDQLGEVIAKPDEEAVKGIKEVNAEGEKFLKDVLKQVEAKKAQIGWVDLSEMRGLKQIILYLATMDYKDLSIRCTVNEQAVNKNHTMVFGSSAFSVLRRGTTKDGASEVLVWGLKAVPGTTIRFYTVDTRRPTGDQNIPGSEYTRRFILREGKDHEGAPRLSIEQAGWNESRRALEKFKTDFPDFYFPNEKG